MKSVPWWLRLALACIIALGCWWRLQAYIHRDFNVDERMELNAGSGPLMPFWKLCFYGESHSFPGDYLLTYPFIQIFNKTAALPGRVAVAIPHALTTLLGFYALWLLGRRYFTHPGAWLVTFTIFAVHRELVYHALGLRPYGTLAALGLTTFYILDSLMNPVLSPSRPKLILAWAALAATVVYHPFSLPMMVIFSIFLVFREWRKTGGLAFLRCHRSFWISLGAIAAPLWLYYMQGHPQNASHQGSGFVFDYIPNPVVHPVGFLKSVAGNLLGSKIAYLLSLGVLLRLFWPPKNRWEIWSFGIVMIGLPILMYLTADVVLQYWFIQRQFVWVMAVYAFFAGLCWEGLLKTSRAK